MIRRSAVFLSVAAALAVPAVASADTTLTLNGPAAKSLRAKGVKIYQQLPARGIGSKIELPIVDGAIGTTATIEQQGQLRFKRGKRKLILKSIQVVIGPGVQRLCAMHGKKRVTIFSIRNGASKPKVDADASTAKLSGGKLRFTPAAAKLLRTKLGKGPNTTLSAGTIKVNAAIPLAPIDFVRPATAVDITSATITWHVKESFADYVRHGAGITASDGATASSTSTYEFDFSTRPGGWWDSVSRTGDVFGQGTIRFNGENFDIAIADPEIELNGAKSRVIFRFPDGKRKVLFGLAATNPSSTPFSPAVIPGFVLEDEGADLFGSFYVPGQEFGNVTVSFTT